MSKVAVVYVSTSGNTEMMANAVADGVRAAGGEVEVIEAGSFDASMLEAYDAYAFGSPAMGAETLEEGTFEPMFASVENSLGSKKVGLFGSYGWGTGEWMQLWQDRCAADGINLVQDGVIANYTPGTGELSECEELGKLLA